MNLSTQQTEEAAEAPVDTLAPIVSDRALMAMIKQRYVPFIFLLRQVQKKPTLEGGRAVVEALQALRPGHRRQPHVDGGVGAVGVAGLMELDVHFSVVHEVLHVTGGQLIDARGIEVHEVTDALLRDALSPQSRSVGREFQSRRYNELKQATEVYERVLRECERADNLDEALGRVRFDGGPMDRKTYDRIKATMNRYGLMREPVFARWVMLEGRLARELELQYVGERLEDVVPRVLRSDLDRTGK